MVTFRKSEFASSAAVSSLKLTETLAGDDTTCVSLESWQVCESDLEDEVVSERRERGRNWDGDGDDVDDGTTGDVARNEIGGVPGQSERPESPMEDK